MRIFKIKKRSGGERIIYSPDDAEKTVLRALLPQIAEPRGDIAHGFRPRKNIVTNALAHRERSITISMDLSDFFPSVKPAMLAGKLPKTMIENPLVFPDGAAQQGLPTSPAIANLAAVAMDDAIVKMLHKLREAGVAVSEKYYTRYADDLSISVDTEDREIINSIIQKVCEIARRCGFRVNAKKTRVQLSRGGRREICGLTVGENVRPQRRFRRRLRAGCSANISAAKNGRARADRDGPSRVQGCCMVLAAAKTFLRSVFACRFYSCTWNVFGRGDIGAGMEFASGECIGWVRRGTHTSRNSQRTRFNAVNFACLPRGYGDKVTQRSEKFFTRLAGD